MKDANPINPLSHVVFTPKAVSQEIGCGVKVIAKSVKFEMGFTGKLISSLIKTFPL